MVIPAWTGVLPVYDVAAGVEPASSSIASLVGAGELHLLAG